MHKIIILLTSFILISACSTGKMSEEKRIMNISTKDNLKSYYSLGCIKLNEMKPEYTPADIFPASRECLLEERYDNSAQLYLLARLYSAYDSQRVSDNSAGQAGTVLFLESFSDLPKEAIKKQSDATDLITQGSGPHTTKFCRSVKLLGPPSYHPDYMIQHGMMSILGSKEGVKQNFDSSKTWDSLLSRLCV